MNIFKHYLRDNCRHFLEPLFLSAIAAALFWLYNLPMQPLLYAYLIASILGLSFFWAPDYVIYLRKARKLEAILRTAPLITLPVEPEGTYQERLLLETLARLHNRLSELEASQANRQEDLLEYYTMWTHQIKTPLAAMGLILQSAPPALEPARRDAALSQEIFKVQRYADMALGYLRIYSMSADLRLESRAVRPIAAKAVKKFAPQFIYKKLGIQLEEFANQVVTDEKWLLFVLEQLISNAVKYTAKGTITISMDERDVLTIKDQGIGIDPADLPRVCERGFTGRNGRIESTSTGLGLYMTKRVVDKLQNQMEILSEVGKGTEVRLFLHRPEPVKD